MGNYAATFRPTLSLRSSEIQLDTLECAGAASVCFGWKADTRNGPTEEVAEIDIQKIRGGLLWAHRPV